MASVSFRVLFSRDFYFTEQNICFWIYLIISWLSFLNLGVVFFYIFIIYYLYLRFDLFLVCTWRPGVLGISSDGDDRRICWGLKLSIQGSLLGRKIWRVYFWAVWFKYGFLRGIWNNWRFVLVPAYLGRVVLRKKYIQTGQGSEIAH